MTFDGKKLELGLSEVEFTQLLSDDYLYSENLEEDAIDKIHISFNGYTRLRGYADFRNRNLRVFLGRMIDGYDDLPVRIEEDDIEVQFPNPEVSEITIRKKVKSQVP